MAGRSRAAVRSRAGARVPRLAGVARAQIRLRVAAGPQERLLARVPQQWAQHVFSDTVATRLSPAVHGDSSGVRGAAWLWPVAGQSWER